MVSARPKTGFNSFTWATNVFPFRVSRISLETSNSKVEGKLRLTDAF